MQLFTKEAVSHQGNCGNGVFQVKQIKQPEFLLTYLLKPK